MRIYHWTEARISKLKKLYETKTANECADILGVKTNQIKSALIKYSLTGRGLIPRYTDFEIERIKILYANFTNKDLAIIFRTKEKALASFGFKLGLKKSKSLLLFHIQKGQFTKGMVAHNKGKKVKPEVIAKMKHTFFKPGSTPSNTKEIGAESIRKDKNDNPYCFLKISNRNWIPKSHYVWEQQNGKVKKGYVIIHKNKDTLDDRPENLEMISKKENMEKNSGPMNLSDSFVAHTIAKKHNHALKKELIENHPDIIELQRNILKLKRACKTTD